MDEEPLAGGQMNAVVRVGDTVRRRVGEWTATVHQLLRHAREQGVTWVPEVRGYDEKGREILSYLPGEVPHGMPAWAWSENVLTDVARALRQWHDASARFDTEGAVWGFDAHAPGEVICHNDFAPYNCVFRDGRFAGAIDFDLCSPGPRLWDIVYTAYRFVPLMPPAVSGVAEGAGEQSPFALPEIRSRLDVFLTAYAEGRTSLLFRHDAVVDTAVERLRAIAAWTADHVMKTGNVALENHAQMYRAHAEWIDNRLRSELAGI